MTAEELTIAVAPMSLDEALTGMPDEVTADIEKIVSKALDNGLGAPTVGVALQVMNALSRTKPGWEFSEGLLYGLAVRRYMELQNQDEFEIPTELPDEADTEEGEPADDPHTR